MVERTVKEVLPALETNKEQVTDEGKEKQMFYYIIFKCRDRNVSANLKTEQQISCLIIKIVL